MPKRHDLHRILIIGAGPIVIGQACEFDYSGTQACLALKQAGYEVILVNSNPATIMTDPELADATYIEPVTPEALSAIIAKERPDALLPTMGGQTALNCALELSRLGVLEKYGVELIGASEAAIARAEDREAFKALLNDIGLATPASQRVKSLEEARAALAEIGLPAIVRPSFTLGGFGGGVVADEAAYLALCEQGLALSPQGEIQVDRSIYGWKEYELEVIRDTADNAIVVCSIENIDPVGIHTGDSITVAPAQTLTDKEYQRMRNAALAIIRAVGVDTGGANVQFAVNPANGEMLVIEMNPRVSRSSALASKATAYPIARVAAQLAVGYTLDELQNEMTAGQIPAAFEPTLDYVVTKIPRFSLEKFPEVSPELGSQMKSVGEVMAIGRNFQASLQKALLSLELGLSGLNPPESIPELQDQVPELCQASPLRLLALAEALRQGTSIDTLQQTTQIDPWFLEQIAELVALEIQIQPFKGKDLSHFSPEDWWGLKQKGFSDARLAQLLACDEKALRQAREAQGCRPSYLQIDSCAAEFEASSDYLYSAYAPACQLPPEKAQAAPQAPCILVVGSGPNRIGQGIEFDYSCVHAVQAIQAAGFRAAMINCNPETVSTDYHVSDRLYFEPMSLEHVLDVVTDCKAVGVVLQLGGQTPLKLMADLAEAGVPILGSAPACIHRAESRAAFQQLVQQLGLKQAANRIATQADALLPCAEALGFPLIIRPSYVLGGRAMKIVHNLAELQACQQELPEPTAQAPLLLERFLDGALEIDVDAVCDGQNVQICGLLEHIEAAGIHSGDSACYTPAQSLSPALQNKITQQLRTIALELGVVGLINGQFALHQGELYVIEVNPRASRTLPFLAKASGIPWVKIALNCMLGRSLAEQHQPCWDRPLPYTAVKEAVLPFARLSKSSAQLGPEMKSTGEVMGLGGSFAEAFAKAQQGAGFALAHHSAPLLLLLGSESQTLAAERGNTMAAGTRFTDLVTCDFETQPPQLIVALGSLNAAEQQALTRGMQRGIPYATTQPMLTAMLQVLHHPPMTTTPQSLQDYHRLLQDSA